MPGGDLSLAERFALEASRLDEPAGEIARRILEDRAGARLRGLRVLAMLAILAHALAHRRGIVSPQQEGSAGDHFRRLDGGAGGGDRPAVVIEVHTPGGAKAAMAVLPIQVPGRKTRAPRPRALRRQ